MKIRRPSFTDIFANILGICAIAAIAGGVIVAYLFFKHASQGDSDFWTQPANFSIIGEFLGGTVGSIWALAGVILFFLALIYQKHELVLQREELKESRKIMESQSTTIAIQQFENTFFQLLNFHINATNNIRDILQGSNGKSVNAFQAILKDFKKEVAALKKRMKADGGIALDDESFEACFRSVFEGYKNTFQHYLENYKSLVLLVEAKSHDPEFYFTILKSHFTEQEVLIQFYYTLLYAKDERLIKTTEKYNLFQKLNVRAISEIDSYHLQKIDKRAYTKDKQPESMEV
ncbi:hypothetical protein E1176_18600 [Fulvivirga sp. RKSG066]|uniref:putative phage abortive infection protein n=1 Tax=Fulvivirga aurantia TaxID=2529383 RepID=UPI0012BCCB0E|nr:putative phage abortive infection protein [Fulvivirga aurantia]MTI23047.1 hypothetical protein [Fulvivirga aurantia]